MFSSSCAVSTIKEELPDLVGPKEAGPLQIVLWSSRQLPEGLVNMAPKLPGVIAAGPRMSGIANLRSVEGADRPLPARPPDAVLPMSFVSWEPKLLAALGGHKEASEALTRGEAVLTRSAADFRGLKAGDSVELSAAGTVKLKVGAVVDEQSSLRAEIVLPSQVAHTLGAGRVRGLLLAVKPDLAGSVQTELMKLAGDVPIRTRAGSTGSAGTGRLLSLFEIKRNFGEFWYRPLRSGRISPDPQWTAENIVQTRVPVLGLVRCHRKIIPQLGGAMSDLEKAGIANLVASYDGCYSPRMTVSDDGVISRHAFGAAIDINASTNRYGAPPSQDQRLVEVMERWGFTWGGRWTVPDGMHFEFLRFP